MLYWYRWPLMFKGDLLNLLGVTLILVGLCGPWFDYHLPQRLGGSPFANAMAHVSVSPFIFTTVVTSTSNRSVYENIGVLRQNSDSFYSVSSSLVGLACILGAIASFVGEYRDSSEISAIAGLVSLVSTMFFYFLLPSEVIFIGIRCSPMWGFWLSLLGSVLVLFSIGFETPSLIWE